MPLKNTLAFVVAAGVLGAASYADTIHVPGDYPTIQAGIDAAQDGDEIVVAAGTWMGEGNRNIDILGKTLTLRSADGPETCIIAGGLRGRGITVYPQSDVVIEGFTIRQCLPPRAGRGGAILCLRSDLEIVRCVIENNRTLGANGGGLYADSSTVLIDRSIFRMNSVGGYSDRDSHGGGLGVYDSSLTLVECTVTQNAAGFSWDGGSGGGIYASESTVRITDSEISGNSAGSGRFHGGSGGGLFVDGTSESTVRITDSEISGNSAGSGYSHGGSGGGLFVDGTLSLVRSSVVGNRAGDGDAPCGDVTGGHGGGVFATGAPVEIVGCLIVGNRAGDGVCDEDDCEYGIACWGFTYGANGGGVHASGNAIITNCTVISNRAGEGGWDGDGDGDGGGVHGGVINNSVVRDNWPSAVAGATSVAYSNIEGGHAGIGNIDSDPLYVDPDNADYRLGPGSPCIDAASNADVPEDVTTDLDGYARFVDDPDTEDTGDGDPPIVDMGAYEFQGRSCPADLDDSGVVDFGDVLVVLRAWGNTGGREDLDGSGVVNFGDVLLVLAAWGPCGA